MTATKDEARVDRIRAVISALTGKGSNNAGVPKELLSAALVGFFLDELRDQYGELKQLLEDQAE